MEATMIYPIRLSGLLHVLLATTAVILVACGTLAAAAPATAVVGNTLVYHVSNGYSREARGKIQLQVDKIDADRITVSFDTDVPALGLQRTAVYTKEGNWLRHALTNHDQAVDYEFDPPYPAYVFPLETGKSWSLRVNAINPVTGRRNNVRVDGEVVGSERISTPAGAFDTIKITRRVYAGDWEGFLRQTAIVETDWYAPALGYAVRSESKSSWQDASRCTRTGCGFSGDWNIFELTEIRSARP